MTPIENFMCFKNPDYDKIPEIALYMDQLLEYLDHALDAIKRTPKDSIYTKTMINNYVKAGLISSPDKKKYTKNSLVDLIAFYHLKQTFSIQDAHAILSIYKKTTSPSPFYPPFCAQFEALKETLNLKDVDKLSIEEATQLMLEFAIDSTLKKELCEQLLDFIQQKQKENVDK